MSHVQGHLVKYLNRNNSAADRLIALKFDTGIEHGTGGIVQMFKVKSQKLRSQRKTATNRPKLSDFKLGMASGDLKLHVF